MTTAPVTHANGTARPLLRSAPTQDRTAALADAMRGILADPGTPEAQRELAAVVLGCTDDEYEAAWSLVAPGADQYHGPPVGARLLPVITLPRQDPPPAATPATRAPWRLPWRSLDGGAAIRLTAAMSVLGVAAIAAVVSYSHIYDLAVTHNESGTAARLLPVSVDGLIVSASMTLLDAARKRLDAPPVAYLMLWLGVGATVAANIAFGLPYGRLAAIVAAWPAVSFVGSVEMALTLARNKAGGDRGGRRSWLPWRWRRRTAIPDEDMADDSDPDTADEPAVVPASEPAKAPPAAPPAKAPAPRRPTRQASAAKRTAESAKAAKADAAIAANPDKTNADIAKLAGVSERTVERRREAARKTSTGAAP